MTAVATIPVDQQTKRDQRFIAAMRQVVDERGREYTYPGIDLDPEDRDDAFPGWYDEDNQAVYVTADGQPACIIGAAVAAMGETVRKAPGHTALDYLSHYGISPTVAHAAQRAQNLHDVGSTWGSALYAFEKTLSEARS